MSELAKLMLVIAVLWAASCWFFYRIGEMDGHIAAINWVRQQEGFIR